MEVSFKFNNGETGQEMVSAILALFGATTTVSAPRITVAAGQGIQATISHADNPATGGDGDESGPVNNATHDTEGFPWDARIHSDKRTVTDKGVWRKRKGAPPHMVAQIQNELRTQGKVVQPHTQGSVTAAPAVATVVTLPTTAASTMPPLPGAAPMPPALPPAAPVNTAYVNLVNFIAENLQSQANPTGRLTEEWVASALKAWGVIDAQGNGRLQVLEHADAERVKAIHQAVGQALGITIAA